MNNVFGITGIRVKFFSFNNNADELNDFLDEYDGNIIDLQYQQYSSIRQVMVVYKAVE